MKNAEIRKNAAIQEVLRLKLHLEEPRLQVKIRKIIEEKFKVNLFIETHAISAWTPKTPIIRYFINR